MAVTRSIAGLFQAISGAMSNALNMGGYAITNVLTQSANDNSTNAATTAYVDQANVTDRNRYFLGNNGSAAQMTGGCLAEPFPRALVNSTTAVTLTSGTMVWTAVTLPKGVTVSKLGWITGNATAGATTHLWLALADSSMNFLAATADQGAVTPSSKTAYSYAINSTAAGSGITSFVTTYAGIYYIGVLVASSNTLPQISGWATVMSGNINSTAGPFLAGTNATDVSLTTPPSSATVYHLPTAVAGVGYVFAC